MKSWKFFPGEKVMAIGNDEGVIPGEVGTVVSRWVDTIYAIRVKDGAFHWVDSTDIDSINPNRHDIEAGDIVQIKSNDHNHSFIKVGDLVQVVKVMNDVDYYKININDRYYWLANFELAPYFPPVAL